MRSNWSVRSTIVVACAVAGSACGAVQQGVSQPAEPTVATTPDATDGGRSLRLADLDDCPGSLQPGAGSREPTFLIDRLQFVEYWVEFASTPTYVNEPAEGANERDEAQFEAPVAISPVVIKVGDPLQSDVSPNEFHERGPVVTPSAISGRLNRLEMTTGESLLLGVYWVEDLGSWIAGVAFGVDPKGFVTSVGRCREVLTARVDELHQLAASRGFKGSAREFLLTTPQDTIERYEFGDPDDDSSPWDELGEPGMIGDGKRVTELHVIPADSTQVVDVCFAQGTAVSDVICVNSQAERGKPITLTVAFGSQPFIDVYISGPTGTVRDAASEVVRAEVGPPDHSRLVVQLSADNDLAVRIEPKS